MGLELRIPVDSILFLFLRSIQYEEALRTILEDCNAVLKLMYSRGKASVLKEIHSLQLKRDLDASIMTKSSDGFAQPKAYLVRPRSSPVVT